MLMTKKCASLVKGIRPINNMALKMWVLVISGRLATYSTLGLSVNTDHIHGTALAAYQLDPHLYNIALPMPVTTCINNIIKISTSHEVVNAFTLLFVSLLYIRARSPKSARSPRAKPVTSNM